jgi:hypothetical protein
MWDWLSNIGSSIKSGWNKLIGNSTDDNPSKVDNKSGSNCKPEKHQSLPKAEDSSGGWLSGVWDSLASGWNYLTGWGNKDTAEQTIESVKIPDKVDTAPSVEKDPPPAYSKEDPYPSNAWKAPEMDTSTIFSIDDVDDIDSDVLHDYHKETPVDPIYPDPFGFLVPNVASTTSGALLPGTPSGFFTSIRPPTPTSTLETPVIISVAPSPEPAQEKTIFHGFGGAFLIAVIAIVILGVLCSCCGCCSRCSSRRKPKPDAQQQMELGDLSPPVVEEPRYPPPVANVSQPSSYATSVKDLPPYSFADPLPAPKYTATNSPEYHEPGRAMLG